MGLDELLPASDSNEQLELSLGRAAAPAVLIKVLIGCATATNANWLGAHAV